MEVQNITKVFDAVSIAAAGSANSQPINTAHIKRLRVVIPTSGANITTKIQGSADGGTTWFDLATYALAATGYQAILELPGPLVRLSASNAGAGAQTINAGIILDGIC